MPGFGPITDGPVADVPSSGPAPPAGSLKIAEQASYVVYHQQGLKVAEQAGYVVYHVPGLHVAEQAAYIAFLLPSDPPPSSPGRRRQFYLM